MKKFSKRFLGVSLSVAMLASQAMPAMAATGGTGHILDFNVDTVLVPTKLAIALNPNEYPINTGYDKLTAEQISAGTLAKTTYYTLNADGKYEFAFKEGDTEGTANFESNKDYYTARTSNDRIVSLNYGIVNKATNDKAVYVDVAATYSDNSAKTPITYVGTEVEAKEGTAANSAKTDELKMYLALESAVNSATVEARSTFEKAESFTSTDTPTYYEKGEDGTFTAPSTQPTSTNFADKTYYVVSKNIGPEIVAAELADVTVSGFAAAATHQAFVSGHNKADASIAYKLGAATYGAKDGTFIDFDTTQSGLKEKLELTELGKASGNGSTATNSGLTAFSLTGSLNKDADWTVAETDSIVFTPVYTVENTTKNETAVANTLNQIQVKQLRVTAATGLVTIKGLTAEKNIAGIELVEGSNTYSLMPDVPTYITWDNPFAEFSFENGGNLYGKLTSAVNEELAGKTVTAKLTLSDNSTVEVPFMVPATFAAA